MNNQNFAGSGQGGHPRKPNTGGNPPKPVNNPNRIDIRINPDVTVDVANKKCLITIRVRLVQHQQFMIGQLVILEEGLSIIGQDATENDGTVIFQFKENMTNVEKIKPLRICLEGLIDEKAFSITIPAIEKPAVPKKKNIPIAVVVMPDANTNTAEIVFSCLVSEENGVICSNQRIALVKGIAQIEEKQTDVNGRATFKTIETMMKADTTVLFRVILPGLTDEVEANVVIPAEVKKLKNDPDSLELYRFHDPKNPCRFKVLARVTEIKGIGIVTPITFFFKGKTDEQTTNGQGLHLVDIPDVINEGDDYDFSAFVSGIAGKGVVKIRRRKRKKSFREKKSWLLTTNNGRALLLLFTTIFLWLTLLFVGLHKSPMINASLFRDNTTGLSGAETLYNESAKMVGEEYLIKKDEKDSSLISGWLFVVCVIFSIVSVPYLILSWREEVLEGIEDGIENILSKDHDRVSDPRLEKWMKYYGMMHVVKNPVAITNNPAVTDAPKPTKEEKVGHPSLMTLFQLDLLSDVMVRILPAIGKKLAGK